MDRQVRRGIGGDCFDSRRKVIALYHKFYPVYVCVYSLLPSLTSPSR